MKLRSGKVLKKDYLPFKLKEKLKSNLQELKAVLDGNEEFAKNLIKIIAEAANIDARHEVSHMIRDTFNNAKLENELADLLPIAGSLLMLNVGYGNFYSDNNISPLFHDNIKYEMLEFFNIPLIGEE